LILVPVRTGLLSSTALHGVLHLTDTSTLVLHKASKGMCINNQGWQPFSGGWHLSLLGLDAQFGKDGRQIKTSLAYQAPSLTAAEMSTAF